MASEQLLNAVVSHIRSIPYTKIQQQYYEVDFVDFAKSFSTKLITPADYPLSFSGKALS